MSSGSKALARILVGSFAVAMLVSSWGCTDTITFAGNNREAGMVAYNEGRYTDSTGSFRAALKQDPRDYMSQYWLGMSYLQLGNYQSASVAFRSCLDTRMVTLAGKEDETIQAKAIEGLAQAIVKSDGSIYFTDPGGPLAPDQFDVTIAGVYRVSADLGSISLIVDDLIGPNGLAFSPDESILYVNDARRRIVRAYDLLPNGTVAKQTSRLFADMGGAEPGVPDGMKVDVAGNVYTGGAGGLYVMDKNGKKLGRIVHGQPATTNVAFGGDDWKTLYFTTRSTLNMVTVKIAGVPVPARKRTS